MRIIDSFIAELEQESKTTRKFLEALPADKLSYKPHEKSNSLGQLAMHVATIPGQMVDMALLETLDFKPEDMKTAMPTGTKDEILAAFEKSVAHCKEQFNTIDDAKAMGTWKMSMSGKELMSMPRIAMIRGWIMNHVYHHRGQLGVYLRLTGALVPSSYGPSGDENPMAEMMEMAMKK